MLWYYYLKFFLAIYAILQYYNYCYNLFKKLFVNLSSIKRFSKTSIILSRLLSIYFNIYKNLFKIIKISVFFLLLQLLT